MKSRLRTVAGAYWRSSLIFFTDSGQFRPRIAYGARVVANQAAIEDSLYDLTNAALRARTASAIFDGFGMASMEYGVDS